MLSGAKRYIAIGFTVMVTGSSSVFGYGMPHVKLGEVCSNAELIVVGRITAVKATDKTLRLTRVLVKGQDLVLATGEKIPQEAKLKQDYVLGAQHATFAVQRVLKGTFPAKELLLELPCLKQGEHGAMTFSMKLERVPRQAPVMLCLCAHKETPGLFTLANAYRSAIAIADVPAVAKLVDDAALPGTPHQQAGALLAASLEEFSKADKFARALSDLINLQGRAASPALQNLLDTSQDAIVRGKVLTALVEIGDYAHLADAVKFLLAEGTTTDAVLGGKRTLMTRMSMVTDTNLIVKLYGPLLRHPDAWVRAEATCAFREIRYRTLVPVFVKGLDDPDRRVRYHSMIALAFALNQFELGWAPDTELFENNEREYLTRWKTWWQTTGQAQFTQPPPAASTATNHP
jgi:hypothetical protein